ncbi:hypothetical protein RND71_015805 [Anisodus tanguticus]|uniref:Uncharacterized protein n=1 Tax=Anisodus tanguticus TaxID=243964 RepID=A0AAE1VD70_9SOLA|nr:hypothetical protein RND71_015805 [Anisodus tanguticus]
MKLDIDHGGESLSVKYKLGFINGECKRSTANSDSAKIRQWESCDDMVTSWIINSLAKEIADSVECVNDLEELWKEIEDRYNQINGAKLYQIQKEINDLGSSIYYLLLHKDEKALEKTQHLECQSSVQLCVHLWSKR